FISSPQLHSFGILIGSPFGMRNSADKRALLEPLLLTNEYSSVCSTQLSPGLKVWSGLPSTEYVSSPSITFTSPRPLRECGSDAAAGTNSVICWTSSNSPGIEGTANFDW